MQEERMEQRNQRTGIRPPMWIQFLNAFRGPKNYPQYLKLSGGRVTGYYFFLVMIITLLAVCVPLTGFLVAKSGLMTYLNSAIPEFEFVEGELTLLEPYEYQNEDVLIKADTSAASYDSGDLSKTKSMEVLISKSNMILYSQGMTQQIRFSDYKMVTINKAQMLQSPVPYYILLGFYVIFSYFGQGLSLFTTVILLALMGTFTNRLYEKRLPFSALLKLAVYASTLLGIVEAVNTGFSLVSGTAASIVGMLWTAFVYFSAVAVSVSLLNRSNG